jgi:hypothetical protein
MYSLCALQLVVWKCDSLCIYQQVQLISYLFLSVILNISSTGHKEIFMDVVAKHFTLSKMRTYGPNSMKCNYARHWSCHRRNPICCFDNTNLFA